MGFLSGLLSGGDGKGQVKRGYNRAMDERRTGFAEGMPELRGGYEKAYGYLNPYIDQGTTANRLYSDFMGVNGTDAQAGAFSNYNSGPWAQYLTQAADRRSNAMGQMRGGAGAAAAANAQQQGLHQYLGGLRALAGQGANVAGAGANLATREGENLFNSIYGHHAGLGDLYVGRGNALAAADQAAMQADIGLIGTGINALTSIASAGMGMPMGGSGGGMPLNSLFGA